MTKHSNTKVRSLTQQKDPILSGVFAQPKKLRMVKVLSSDPSNRPLET